MKFKLFQWNFINLEMLHDLCTWMMTKLKKKQHVKVNACANSITTQTVSFAKRMSLICKKGRKVNFSFGISMVYQSHGILHSLFCGICLIVLQSEWFIIGTSAGGMKTIFSTSRIWSINHLFLDSCHCCHRRLRILYAKHWMTFSFVHPNSKHTSAQRETKWNQETWGDSETNSSFSFAHLPRTFSLHIIDWLRITWSDEATVGIKFRRSQHAYIQHTYFMVTSSVHSSSILWHLVAAWKEESRR